MPQPQVVVEWRVSGNPTVQLPDGVVWAFPPYSFTWYSNRKYDSHSRLDGKLTLNAEQAARRFIDMATRGEAWKDGPHLHSHMVIYNPWKLEETDG